MIAHVVVSDLIWLAVALLIRLNCPRRMRILASALACYIAVETFLHVPMENAAAWIMGAVEKGDASCSRSGAPHRLALNP